MLREDAIAHVELVDVLLALKDLPATILERVTSLPGLLANIDPLVYSLGARPITPEVPEPAEQRRIFHLCLSPEGLLVDGLLAVRVQRRATALAIMQVLMTAYAEAAASGRTVEPVTPDTLADAVQPIVDGTIEDADSIARHIPRIRKSIIETVRRYTGKPIGQHDVIETVSRSDADEDGVGYRLNPRSVALGPLQL